MACLKHRLRAWAARFLYHSGLLWIIAEFRLHGRAAVLMYHRVLPAGSDSFSHAGIIVTPETFDRHLRFLRRHFRLLGPAEFATELSQTGFGRRRCLVTFDDGWHDNCRHALPLLQKHGVPAVVFVATGYIGTDRTFWQERLTRLLYEASRLPAPADDPLADAGATGLRSLGAEQARRQARERVTSLKLGDPEAVERLIGRLESIWSRAGEPVPGSGEDRFLSWDEARRLHDSGIVTIGSHAHTHTPLTGLGPDRARAELRRSRDELAGHGLPAPAICAYPNGNVDDAVEDAARSTGFSLGFATGRGRVAERDNPMRLRRINVHDRSSGSDAEYLCLILGVL